MPDKKSGQVKFIRKFDLEVDGMILDYKVKVKKIYDDNLNLFPEEEGVESFLSFIKKLRGDKNKPKDSDSSLNELVDHNEILHLLFQLNLDSISLKRFFNIIGSKESPEGIFPELLKDFNLSNPEFRDFFLQKRIIPNQNEDLFDLLVSKIHKKIESLFSKMLIEEIKNIGGLANLTTDNIDKCVSILLDKIHHLITDEVILILNQETEIYLPLASDNIDIRNLKSEFYINLFASLKGALTPILRDKLDKFLYTYLNSETHKWEQLIPEASKRKRLKAHLQKCLKSKVIEPCIQDISNELIRYLKDNILVKDDQLKLLNKSHKKINKNLSKYKGNLDNCKKNLDQALQRELIPEESDKEVLPRDFIAENRENLLKQAAIYLSAKELLIFFALLKYEMNDFLKKKLDQDSFNKIRSFDDLIGYFNFQKKDFICTFKDLYDKGREQEAKILLLETLEDLFLPDQNQSEQKDNLKSNDSGSDVVLSQARNEAVSSGSIQITASPCNVSTGTSFEEEKKNSLALDKSCLQSKTQIEMNENKNQSESKDKLKSNDSNSSKIFSFSSRKRLSLHTVLPTKNIHHHAVDEKLSKKKGGKGLKSKFSKLACGLTCGIFHRSKKANLEEEAYRPVAVKRCVTNQAT